MANTSIFDAHLHFFSRQVFDFYAKQVPDLKGMSDPAAAAITRLGVEPPPPEPEALARELLLLVDGAIVTASIQRDARAADDAREAAARVIAGFGR